MFTYYIYLVKQANCLIVCIRNASGRSPLFYFTCTDSFFQASRRVQLDNFFLTVERIQIPLKVGHHRPASDVSLADRWWPNIECWLGSFVIFQGFRNSIANELYSFAIFRGPWPPVAPTPFFVSAPATSLCTSSQVWLFIFSVQTNYNFPGLILACQFAARVPEGEFVSVPSPNSYLIHRLADKCVKREQLRLGVCL